MSGDYSKLFSEEAEDQVNQAEESLLKYEDQPDSLHIEDAFRALHTIKGASYMFNLKALGDYAHTIEDILEGVKENVFELNEETMPNILNGIDLLRQLLQDQKLESNSLRQSLADSSNVLEDYRAEIKELVKQKRAGVAKPLLKNENQEIGAESLNTYYLLIEPQETVNDNDDHPIHDSIAELKEKEFCIETTHHLRNSNGEYTEQIKHWDIYLASEESQEELASRFLFFDDEFNIKIHHIASYNIFKEKAVLEKIKAERKKENGQDIQALKRLVKSLEKQLDEQENLPSQQKKSKSTYVRIPTDKIEVLLNGISELVTSKSALNNFKAKFKDQDFNTVVEHIHQITDNLRDTILNVSLVPVDSLLVKFKRLVSDTSRELSKKVNFHVLRSETEMDKKMIDAISDPLMHIFRNCVDHGIESPQERVDKGKEETGNIYFDSYYRGANIIISVKDDGRGMNLVKIREKAIANNLITPEQELTDNELKKLIFQPGFSTAQEISGVSGRGVGMDVVLTNLKSINGKIDILSKEEEGSEFIMTLPLTLSIIEGLHTSLGDTAYIFPINYIHKIEKLKKTQILKPKGVLNDTVVISGEQVQIVDLRKRFGDTSEMPEESALIFLSEGDRNRAYLVDKVVGQIQTVIKPLGSMYKDKDFLSGSTILGDGSVALVLDPANLINLN